MPERLSTQDRAELPARVTMPLLTLITQQAIDDLVHGQRTPA